MENFNINLDLWERFKSVQPTYEFGTYYSDVNTWHLEDFDDEEVFDLYDMLLILIGSARMEDFKKLGKHYETYSQLIKRSYFDEDVSFIRLNAKKPFGNSNIKGDIASCITKEYLDYLESIGMDLRVDSVPNYYQREIKYMENGEILTIYLDYRKIDTHYFIKEFNHFLLNVIQNLDFKYHRYELHQNTEAFLSKVGRSDYNFSNFQEENMIKLNYPYFCVPCKSYERDIIIDEILDNENKKT